MAFIPKVFCISALGLMISMPLSAQTTDINTPVAKVGDTEITIGHVLDIKRNLPEQYQTLPDDVLFKGLVDQLVQQQMLANTVQTAPGWLPLLIENQTRNVLANAALGRIHAAAVTEDTLQQAYAAEYLSDTDAREYNASHILIDTEDQATALVAEVQGGADFAELARTYSTGPSGPSGGALGWFGAGDMVPAFEAAVVGLEKGAVSAPVETQFGWHVVKLNDIRAVVPPTLDEVRDDLVFILQNSATDAILAELTERTVIERSDVDPSVLSTLSLDDQP
ncbi:MAG: peptidylprolyl isomerase [Pseudomonadota bacterium]